MEKVQPDREWYFWGWVEYDDVFEGTSRHRTEFCFWVERVRFPQTGAMAMGLRPHSRFSAVDRDCLRPPEPDKQKH